jgi:hypothetical protein
VAEVADAYVSLIPSARGFGTKLTSQVGGEVDGAGKKIGAGLGNAIKVGAVAALAGAAILTRFLGGALDEAREAQVVTARTENVIKKMGKAAGVSAKQVANLAGAISAKTGIDDEAIQSGQNLLLTFGNIRNEAGKGNDIFNQTSKLMVDLSAAMGTDAKSSAVQLGKALNDPLKGLTALTRVGVSFTEQQSEQIKKMVESGNVLGAQKVILGELERQFGGAAAAMATPADKARVAFDNLKEQIGTALLPVVDRLLTIFTSQVVPAVSLFVTQMQTGVGAGGQFAAVMTTAGSALATMAGFVRENATVIIPLVTGLIAAAAAIKTVVAVSRAWAAAQLALNVVLVANPIGIVVVALAALGAALVLAYRKSETFRNIVNGAFSAVRAAVTGAVAAIVSRVVAFGQAIIARVQDVAQFVTGLKQKFGEALDYVKSVPGKIMDGLGNLGSLLLSAGVDLVRGLIDGIKSMAAAAADAALDVVQGAIIGAKIALGISSPSKVFHEIGMWSMLGFAEGIEGNGQKVLDALKGVQDKLKTQIDSIKSDFASLSTSIASAFTGNLFEATTASGFISNLSTQTQTVAAVSRAFKKLMKWGLDPKFLSALFQSGNSALILDLARGGRVDARMADRAYGGLNSLTNQLGNQVARNEYGPNLDRLEDRLQDINRAIKQIGRDVGREINGSANQARRRSA